MMSGFESSDLEESVRLLCDAMQSHQEEARRLTLRADRGPRGQSLSQSLACFDRARPLQELVDTAITLLSLGSVQGSHPAHFGFFRAATGADVVLAEALVALFDPQLALRVEAPALCALEDQVLGQLADRFQFPGAASWATSGASESNRLAVLAALALQDPELIDQGLAGRRPRRVYASEDAHGSIEKAVVSSGLGRRGYRRIPVDGQRRLRLDALQRQIEEDRAAGFEPLMVVATLGTTAGGAVDDIPALAIWAKTEELFLHVDAAWGGIAAFSKQHQSLLAGLDLADSLAMDGHKILGLPTGNGVFFSRRADWAARVFDPQDPNYMPERSNANQDFSNLDPYRRSPLWSRRLSTLGLCFRLASAGWSGIEEKIEGRFTLADSLERDLEKAGWQTQRYSALPLVLFRRTEKNWSAEEYARRIRRRGRVWLAAVEIGGVAYLRVSLTNLRSGEEDLKALFSELEAIRLDLS